jgi:alanyl-tRNA synthetase
MKTSAELRSLFLNYFAKKQHEIIPSSSLVPSNDPTLLFTNAGMVQFKDVFLGADLRPYTRATSSQRCVRAGGKHNDLENVGYTARHHTFFEMLGNFSFGDYFKKEAIRFAWEFLTKELGLPAEKLWVTIFHEDEEAADIWLKDIGVDPTRFSRCGEADNFWSMGDTGPCGPCTEIFYDHGPEIPGGPPGSPDQDGDRYIEIWNIVFMQYDRLSNGEMQKLPKPSVDTGMGLERLCAVLQGVHNNYETDLFVPLIKAVAKEAQCKDLTNTSLRVIADHIRSSAFLITDGVVPANEGRGYVLRRIIRRAIRHGSKLGLHDKFFYKLVAPLVEVMGDAYPELKRAQQQVELLLAQEEEQFAKTLEQGLRIFEQSIAELAGDTIPGTTLFKLYDTYGFPPDLTGDMARERGLKLDMAGFEACMQQQRLQSQQHSRFAVDYHDQITIEGETLFSGYHEVSHEAKIIAIINQQGQSVEELKEGEEGTIFLERTPFYAESGGQVGDQGALEQGSRRFIVQDTKKQKKLFAHHGRMANGSFRVADAIHAQVDAAKRQATALNHTATHLLHAALRKVLGNHVEQKGSLVDPMRLRFDFTNLTAMTSEQLRQVEDMVNAKVRENIPVDTRVMPVEQAIAAGAIALFGEKYGDEVRVLSVGEFSVELCGGTHAKRTGDIGVFHILSEAGISSGIRRIEAVTGQVALEWARLTEERLSHLAEQLNAKPENAGKKLNDMLLKTKRLEKEVEQLTAKLASGKSQDLLAQAEEIAGIPLIASVVTADLPTLRDMVDQLKSKMGSGVVVLAAVDAGKANIIVGVTKDLVSQIQAGQLVNFIAEQVGGKGGGRPDMAQAGGPHVDALPQAMTSIQEWIKQRVTQ